MNIHDVFKNFKNPLVWIIIISIIAVIIIIIIISIGNSKVNNCPAGEVKYCGNICTKKCPEGHPIFDCKTKKCKCISGFEECEDGNCCVKGGCHKDTTTGKTVCCADYQICTTNDGSSGCCGGGLVVKNKGDKCSTCAAPCGFDNSLPHFCNPGESCIEIKNLNEENKQELIKHGERINNDTLYMCKNPDEKCSFGNPIVSPPVINNFYPCFNLEKNDTGTGLGFCSSKIDDLNTRLKCFNTHKIQDLCHTDSECTWIDLNSQMTNSQTANKMSKDLLQLLGDGQGKYCNKGESYSRVIGFPVNDTKKCNISDCWAEVGQPGVTTVLFDGKTCSALQDCSGTGKSLERIVNGKDYNPVNIDTKNTKFTKDCKTCPQEILTDPANHRCVPDSGNIETQKLGWHLETDGSCSQSCIDIGKNYCFDTEDNCKRISKNCPSDCNGNGSCNYQNGVCTCNQGWYGPACQTTNPGGTCTSKSHYEQGGLECGLNTSSCLAGYHPVIYGNGITSRCRCECEI